MKKLVKQLALEAGGSHYPDVGGALLEKFAELTVRRCAHIANQFDDTGNAKIAILREFELDHD